MWVFIFHSTELNELYCMVVGLFFSGAEVYEKPFYFLRNRRLVAVVCCVAIYRKSADFSAQHFCEWKHHHVHSLCERMQMINTRPLKYVLLQKKTKYSLSIWSFYGSRIFLLANEMFWKRIARCRDTFDEITRSTAKLIAPASSSSDQHFSIGASVSSYKKIRFFFSRIAQKRVYIFQIWQSANFTPLLCVFHTSLLAVLR